MFHFVLKWAAYEGSSRRRARQCVYIHSGCENEAIKTITDSQMLPGWPWWPAELRLEGSNPNNPATEIKINAGRDLLPGGSSPRSSGSAQPGTARVSCLAFQYHSRHGGENAHDNNNNNNNDAQSKSDQPVSRRIAVGVWTHPRLTLG